MIKYRTNYSKDKIEKVEIVRETPKMVVVVSHVGGERREAKQSDWACYFDTWAEARDYLLDAARKRVAPAADLFKAELKKMTVVEDMVEF